MLSLRSKSPPPQTADEAQKKVTKETNLADLQVNLDLNGSSIQDERRTRDSSDSEDEQPEY